MQKSLAVQPFQADGAGGAAPAAPRGKGGSGRLKARRVSGQSATGHSSVPPYPFSLYADVSTQQEHILEKGLLSMAYWRESF